MTVEHDANKGSLVAVETTLPPMTGRGQWLRRWQIWASIALLLSSLTGLGALSLMLRQPGVPNCDRIFWPLASASLRIYCAQVRANRQTLEDLFAAITLVNSLSEQHPLRSAINPLIEHWSNQVLDLAETTFHEGDLERAIASAQRIPKRTTAYRLVEARIQRWQTIWQEGETIYAQAQAALEAEDWRRAFAIMVRLLDVNNRYWSNTQYEALNQTILQAQQDETQLLEARRLFRSGEIDNLAKALEIAQTLGVESIFRKSGQTLILQVSQRLLQIAEAALTREDLTTALDAAQRIPKNLPISQEAEDFVTVAYASASAWTGSVISLEDAIAQIQKIKPDSPLYARAQARAAQWQTDIGYAQTLQEARTQAQQGGQQGLSTAIAQATQVSSQSTLWRDAQANIDTWEHQLQTLEDQPLLDQAEQLAIPGQPQDLQAAIAQAQKIGSGRALHAEAQDRIQTWRSRLERFSAPTPRIAPLPTGASETQNQRLLQNAESQAAQGTPDTLTAAIEVANQVAQNSTLRFEADMFINHWGEQLLELARSRANYNLPEAIAIARQVPRVSRAYEAAQIQLRDWQQQAPPQPR
ncbi:hypothetical protein GS597_16615 [Synechococcales cyanobacterium C]|uniref:Chromosome segregation ATPase n=1 Tax=Petrachloros mirabilis ULC683 TaxID=2781853 RepID=A0A8K1ZZB7_9CYAN|nr:hypothetical protein [Petrachloros mirabilis]NCJ08100.1 hypothetical protein [Petrachloros mirabilis ULC683]